MTNRRGGYRIWANGDRGEVDFDLRQARKRIARAIRQGCSEATIADLRECERRMNAAVLDFEARYGSAVAR